MSAVRRPPYSLWTTNISAVVNYRCCSIRSCWYIFKHRATLNMPFRCVSNCAYLTTQCSSFTPLATRVAVRQQISGPNKLFATTTESDIPPRTRQTHYSNGSFYIRQRKKVSSKSSSFFWPFLPCTYRTRLFHFHTLDFKGGRKLRK